MARRPKANSHDNTIRNMIIGFLVVILIIGGLLIWNNRALSYAGTVDGVRMPIEHFNFYQNQAWETLVFWSGMPDNAETAAWAMEIGFEGLVELHLTAIRAAEFGLSLADVDPDEVRESMDAIRAMYERPEIDMIAALGFSNASFRRFVELQVLHGLVHEHVIGLATLDEEEMAEAFEQHMLEIDTIARMNEVLVHWIEVETEELANTLHGMILVNPDNFTEYMREHTLGFDEDALELDDAGEPILTINVDHTPIAWDSDTHNIPYAMEVGDISGVIQLLTDTFAIFEVVEINEVMTRDEMEMEFIPFYEEHIQNMYFRERVEQWIEEANVVLNERVFG